MKIFFSFPFRFPHLVFYVFIILSSGCSEKNNNSYQGYVEGEYVMISSPLSGQLEKLMVSRGDTVAAGDSLFSLEHDFETAQVAEAQQELKRTENRLADLTKGKRPSEIKALEAKLAQARISFELARTEFDRREKLYNHNTIPKEELDRTRTEMERSNALISQLEADIKTAKLGARSDAIKAAEAELSAARDRLEQARWKLEQKFQAAPSAGLVYDTFYVEGEFVPASYPVLSLLPPGNVIIRFFVPEPVVGTLSVGRKITAGFDNAAKSYAAAITYISPQAEYTPPVIYSRDTRSKLIYMIEARPDPGEAVNLHPGQPLDIHLGPDNG